MSKDNMKHRRLQELDESDFEIVDGQPDIRGWDVKTAEGITIGEVDELILDARERKVRYMVVDLDDDELDLDKDRKVLIPIGTAQLHEKDDDVILENITLDQLRQLPEYERDNLTNETEYAISSVLGRSGTYSGDVMNADFYQHEHFNEDNLYNRRLPQSTTSQSSERKSWLQSREGLTDSEVEGYTGSYDDTTGLGRERNFTEEEVHDDVLSPVGNTRTGSTRLDDLEDESDETRENDIERRNRRDTDRPGSGL